MSDNSDTEYQQGLRGGNSSEKELACQQIQIQSKRFYIDVKENQRGRFIKIAEIGIGGKKSRILLTMSAAEDFKKHLVEFTDIYTKMPNGDEKKPVIDSSEKTEKDNEGVIKTETFIKDSKRYFLDLKENQKGIFLRISMVVSGPRGARTQVAIPAQGLVEFKDHFCDMFERYNTQSQGETNEEPVNLPESKTLRADNKTFFFDSGSNPRGVYLKISEVRLNRYRTSITIPEKYIAQFAEQIKEFVNRTGSLKSETEKVTAEISSIKIDDPVK